MSTKEVAHSVIESLSEEKLRAFITLFADENTLARMESHALISDSSARRYKSFNEFLRETESE